MSHLIKHYIENQKLIPMLLDFGWIVRNDTWTDCPLKIQKRIEKEQLKIFQKKWGNQIVQEDKTSKGFDINPIIKIPIRGV